MQTHTVHLIGRDSLIVSPLTIGELIQVMAITGASNLVSPVGGGLEVRVTLTQKVPVSKSTELKFSKSDKAKKEPGPLAGTTQDMDGTSNG